VRYKLSRPKIRGWDLDGIERRQAVTIGEKELRKKCRKRKALNSAYWRVRVVVKENCGANDAFQRYANEMEEEAKCVSLELRSYRVVRDEWSPKCESEGI
jgi:hypothetical protein